MPSHSLDVLARLVPRIPARLVERAAAWTGRSRCRWTPRSRPAWSCCARPTPGWRPTCCTGTPGWRSRRRWWSFPGGGLDPADRADADPVRRCAVRETEEETGVRLAPDALRALGALGDPGAGAAPLRHLLLSWPSCRPGSRPTTCRARPIAPSGPRRPRRSATSRPAGSALMPPTLSILLELAELGSLADVRRAAAGPGDRAGAAPAGPGRGRAGGSTIPGRADGESR